MLHGLPSQLRVRSLILGFYEQALFPLGLGLRKSAEKILTTGEKDAPKDLPANVTPTQWAAYTAMSRVLLNLDETITRE